MTKKIQTYDDLLEEKRRLEALLAVQKEEIDANWHGVKSSLNPLNNAASFLGKITRSDKSNPLLTVGIGYMGDLVLRKFFKAGWLVRLVVPFVVKNYSSHMFAGKGTSLASKVKNLFRKKQPSHNGMPDLTTSDWQEYQQ
jgi:hypothetical protein